MYIEIYNKKNQFAKIGRKLFKKMNFKKGHPAFIQIVKLKGSDKFAIIKRTPSETFKTQCNMVERTGERDTIFCSCVSIVFFDKVKTSHTLIYGMIIQKQDRKPG